MPRTINDLLQTVKFHCDNDTIMFVFKNDVLAKAYNRTIIYSPWKSYDEEGDLFYNEDDIYYVKKIMKRMVVEPCMNIYYKNPNGVWVDYRKCLSSYPTLSIVDSSVRYQNIVQVDINIIPRCEFTDSEWYVHRIDEHDGFDNLESVPNIELDTNDINVVKIKPFSIENPTLPSTASHIMQDLKIELPINYTKKDFLVWLNGVFVPSTEDELYENVFYLKNAMTMINSRCVNQKINSFKSYIPENGATVKLDKSNNEYRYDIKMRLFGWQGVEVSDWYKPLVTRKIPISYNFSSIYIVNSITFPVEVDPDAHMICENGIILDPSDYIIDGLDRRKITLKGVENRSNSILNELIKDMTNNIEYYGKINPLNILSKVLTDKTYSLINFSSKEVDKKVYLKRSYSCATQFPYANEMTFSSLNAGDLVLINGTYNQYEWIHKHTISFPKMKYSFNGKESKISEDQVCKIYFIVK